MTKLPPPIRAARRRSPAAAALAPARRAAVPRRPTHCWNRRFRLGRGRRNEPAVGADAGYEAAFRAGAGLALLDQILRLDPPFAGALRQRLALARRRPPAPPGAPSRGFFRAARRRASFAQRRRERAHQPRRAHPSAVARFRRALRSRFDEPTLAPAADLLELPRDLDFEALAEALRRLFQGEENPLAAAARAGSTTTRTLDGAPRAETEILALWLSDLMLARKLGWDAPIALLATTIARPSSRSAGRRPRPGDADWPLHAPRPSRSPRGRLMGSPAIFLGDRRSC